MSWKARLSPVQMVEAAKLQAHPGNARRHGAEQLTALHLTLGELGWIQSVIVSKRSNRILDGHARVALAAEAAEKVPVVYADVTKAEEAAILASFDAIGRMAVEDGRTKRTLVERVLTGVPKSKELLGLLGVDVEKALELAAKSSSAVDEGPPPTAAATFVLVFDNEADLRKFHGVLRESRKAFPKLNHSGDRLLAEAKRRQKAAKRSKKK